MLFVETDWDSPIVPRPGIHWHGFFWKGHAGHIFSMKYQIERTPGNIEFDKGDTPAEFVADNLRRPRLVKGTWTDINQAVAWTRSMWDQNTPITSHKDPDECEKFVYRSCVQGGDSVWSWDLPRSGDITYASVYLLSCPNSYAPKIPCPEPPRTSA